MRPGLDRVSAELCGNRIILVGDFLGRQEGDDPVGPRDSGRRSRRTSVSGVDCGGVEGLGVWESGTEGKTSVAGVCKVRGFLFQIW